MKKRIAAVLAALLVLSCGTTVLAADSADAAALAENVKITTEDGKNVEFKEVTADIVEAAEEAALAENEEAKLLALVDVQLEEGATITFAVEGVTEDSNIIVLHFNGEEWEVITPDAVADGKVTVTLESFSPVAIVELPAEEADEDIEDVEDEEAEEEEEDEKSPATGVSVVLPMAAMICVAGATGCARKVKFN